MKKIFVLIILLIVFVCAGGGLYLYQKQNSPKYTGEIKTIRVANIGEFTIYNPLAKELGLFSEYGLNAEITEYESGPPAIADLLSGKVDVAVAADFVGVRNIFTNPNLRIITQESRHDVFKLVALKDHDIASPQDLVGKKIGVTKKGAGEFYLGRFLIANQISIEDVTTVDLTPPQMISQLEQGELDAILIFDPHAYNLTKKFGEDLLVWPAQAGQKTFALLYSTDEFTKSNPDIIERYLRALLEAENFTRRNPGKARELLSNTLKYEDDYIEYMWEHFSFEQGLDQELLLTMEDQANFLIGHKLVESTEVPNYLNFIYFDALEKAKPRAVTITH